MECRDLNILRGRTNDHEGLARPRLEEQYDHADIHDCINTILSGAGIDGGTVGTELDVIKAETRDWFLKANPNYRFVDAALIVYDMRAVKSPHEVDALHKAARLFETGYTYAVDRVELDQPMATLCGNFRRGVMDTVNNNSSLADCDNIWIFSHIGDSSTNRIAKDDVVKQDCGVHLDSYYSGCCRYAYFGQPSAEHRQIHQALSAGFEAALNMLRPDNTVLQPGMVLYLETPLYTPGIGGFNLEDVIHITEDSHENLNSLPRDFRSIV